MTLAELSIPQGWDAITAGWMTAALAAHHPGAAVDNADLVALTSVLFHEPRLFSSGVVLPLDHPTVYATLIDEEHDDFLIVMEDVVGRGQRRARDRPVAQRLLGRPADRQPGPGVASRSRAMSSGAYCIPSKAAFTDLDSRAALDAIA